jgi:copper chaperone CopZ
MNNNTLRLGTLVFVLGLIWGASTPTSMIAGSFSEAFVAPHKVRTDTIAVPGMQCGMCEETISRKLRSLGGVRNVSADAEGKRVIVTYDPARVTRRSIGRTIAAVGYDTGSARATTKAKAALPECCRVR